MYLFLFFSPPYTGGVRGWQCAPGRFWNPRGCEKTVWFSTFTKKRNFLCVSWGGKNNSPPNPHLRFCSSSRASPKHPWFSTRNETDVASDRLSVY